MSRALRNALGCFATGVTVITTRHQEQDAGMTCSSFNTVSLEPALVLWSLQHNATSGEAFLHGGGYTVNVLSAEQRPLVMKFASGTQEERFADLTLERAPSGRVLLPGCVAWFDCSLHQTVEAGDHDVLIGRVEAFDCLQGQGLIFERSQLGVMQAAA